MSRESSSEEEYVVERIIDRRLRRGHTEYLVKWEGYPAWQNTWEPRNNLTNCKEVLAEFERDNRRAAPVQSARRTERETKESQRSVKNGLHERPHSLKRRGRPRKDEQRENGVRNHKRDAKESQDRGAAKSETATKDVFHEVRAAVLETIKNKIKNLMQNGHEGSSSDADQVQVRVEDHEHDRRETVREPKTKKKKTDDGRTASKSRSVSAGRGGRSQDRKLEGKARVVHKAQKSLIGRRHRRFRSYRRSPGKEMPNGRHSRPLHRSTLSKVIRRRGHSQQSDNSLVLAGRKRKTDSEHERSRISSDNDIHIEMDMDSNSNSIKEATATGRRKNRPVVSRDPTKVSRRGSSASAGGRKSQRKQSGLKDSDQQENVDGSTPMLNGNQQDLKDVAKDDQKSRCRGGKKRRHSSSANEEPHHVPEGEAETETHNLNHKAKRGRKAGKRAEAKASETGFMDMNETNSLPNGDAKIPTARKKANLPNGRGKVNGRPQGRANERQRREVGDPKIGTEEGKDEAAAPVDKAVSKDDMGKTRDEPEAMDIVATSKDEPIEAGKLTAMVTGKDKEQANGPNPDPKAMDCTASSGEKEKTSLAEEKKQQETEGGGDCGKQKEGEATEDKKGKQEEHKTEGKEQKKETTKARILGLKPGGTDGLGYVVEWTNPQGEPLVAVMQSKALKETHPTLIIDYLESQVVFRKDIQQKVPDSTVSIT